MTDTTPFGFGKLVPGFDFLQNLASSAVKGAQQGLPNMPNLSSWVAPTLSVEEIEKRISELKAVQFWLDQNARALAATIQALEVQKMTLATLKGMNFSMGDVAKAFQVKTADMVAEMQKASANLAAAATAATAAAAPEPAPAPAPAPEPEPEPAPEPAAAQAEAPTAPGVIDPLQWWGALTQQFQQIATDAIKDTAVAQALDSTRNLATDLAREALKTTAEAVSAGVQAAKAAKAAKTGQAAQTKAAPDAPAAKGSAKTAAKKAPAARKTPAAKKATPAKKSTPRRAT